MVTKLDHCSHWRALTSRELDGELSELEKLGLHRHLAGCTACAAWRRESDALARLLRESERELPSQAFAPAVLRRRVARVSTLAATSISAAAAALAVLAFELPLNGVPLVTPRGAGRATAAPCTACMKYHAITTALAGASTAAPPPHVASPTLGSPFGPDEP